jgi:DNA repair exonuclease SbcCD ATPase subunit
VAYYQNPPPPPPPPDVEWLIRTITNNINASMAEVIKEQQEQIDALRRELEELKIRQTKANLDYVREVVKGVEQAKITDALGEVSKTILDDLRTRVMESIKPLYENDAIKSIMSLQEQLNTFTEALHGLEEKATQQEQELKNVKELVGQVQELRKEVSTVTDEINAIITNLATMHDLIININKGLDLIKTSLMNQMDFDKGK